MQVNQEMSEKLEATNKFKELIKAKEKEMKLDNKKLAIFKKHCEIFCHMVRGLVCSNVQQQKRRDKPSNMSLVQVVVSKDLFSDLMQDWHDDWVTRGKSLTTGNYDLKLIVPILFAKLGNCKTVQASVLSKLIISRWSIEYQGEWLKAQIITCKNICSRDYCISFGL
jgi:hypothetical protein